MPKVSDKLKEIGLPIEMLVYKSIVSFYANYFCSDIVFRLWDVIIFNFCGEDKRLRRRGLWWLLSPAFYVLREKQEEILQARNFTDILKIYESGGSLTYNADEFIKEID